MSRLDELINIEREEHEDDIAYSYSINSLIQQDIESNKELAGSKTLKELSEMYDISYGTMAKILRMAGVKARRTYRKCLVEKKIRAPKMTQEEHEITFWASSFNKGKLRYVYYDMLRRCYKETDKGYCRYGARGITVCEEWRKDCKAFYRWAKENGYDIGLQIDRIDNNKGYSPENCRWVTPRENSMNRSCTRRVTFNGETHTLKEWSELTGISYQVLADRIYRYKWSVAEALTKPVV